MPPSDMSTMVPRALLMTWPFRWISRPMPTGVRGCFRFSDAFTLVIMLFLCLLRQGFCAADQLRDLAGDDGLTGTVERERVGADELAGGLRRGVHGAHAGRELRGRAC